MGESMANFPTEIWIHIVSKGSLNKAALASISLVSRALREVAQRKLFHDVTLRYQSLLPMYDTQVDLCSYEAKVLGICTSSRLCSFIQQLRIVFCNNAPWDMLHTNGSDKAFYDMVDKVALALPTMVLLSRISYNAPILFGNLHRAILLHSHLKVVVITPSTCCKTPCKEASVCGGSLQELEISEWSPMQPIHGLTSSYVGARRCYLTSNILVTYSLSLRKLRVPLLLLYDALAALSTLPEFPHLNTLSIMRFCPLLPLGHLYDSMEDHVVRFLLHVHQTIEQLDWRPYALFNPFKRLPSSCFPKLETLEGEGVELLLGNHALRRLRFIAPPGPAIRTKKEEEKTSLKALRECQMSSPQLTTLFVQHFIISWELGPVIAAFSALEELSCTLRIGMGPGGPELDDLGFTPLTGLIDLVERLFDACISHLPHLHTLSIQAYDTGFNEPIRLEAIITLASSLRSESLKRFNFRLNAYEFEASPLDLRVYESVELHRICDTEGGRSQWIAPQGKVTISDYVHCEVHMQCSLNRPLGHYESWIEI